MLSTSYHVHPVTDPKPITVSVPGSKSITNRALLLSSLAEGESQLNGTLFSDDSRHFLNCLMELGFPVTINEAMKWVRVTGFGGSIPKKEARLYVGSAGTAARFLTAMLGLSDGTYYLDASLQMRKRPMKPLLDSLRSIGVSIICHEQEDCFPFTIQGNPNTLDHIQVNIESSSQFLSALLMSAPMKKNGLLIELVGGSHALSYVQITAKMMNQFGCLIKQISTNQYLVEGGQTYRSMTYQIEPDVSAACYFYAMSPLLHTDVLVRHVHYDTMQGDIRFLNILEQMGCKANDTPEGIMVSAPAHMLLGIDIDMSDCSDQSLTLAAIAPFAASPVRIRGISHIKLQECDRIHAILTELAKLGIVCREEESGVWIQPGKIHGAEIETYDDHRVAMSFSLIGLKIPGIILKNPACCKKTFEDYFQILESVTR